MAKQRNQRIYSNREHLEMLADEQKNYIGRDYHLDLAGGCLTIYALPRRHKKSKDGGKVGTKGSDLPKNERNKREEKFERRG